jgi:tetratricopeptide (TPR) repeat protein
MNPKSVKAYERLCAAYYNAGDFSKASDNCDQALTIDPTYLDAIAMKGQVEYRGRDYEDAVSTLEDCVAAETFEFQKDNSFSRNEECWLYLGLAKFTLARCGPENPDVDSKDTRGAVSILNDLLDWATTESVIRLARDGITRCATAFQGQYQTPTPKPTPTEKPTPILLP